MSRAFVKEDSGDQPEQLPERPVSPHPNYMTATGYRTMVQQVAALDHELHTLKADLSLTSLTRQAVIQRDLNYYRSRVASAIQVEPATSAPSRVIFGCEISFIDEQDQQHSYRIVGEDEADIANKRISWRSPLANALLGKQAGDQVLWQKPQHSEEIEITEIRP